MKRVLWAVPVIATLCVWLVPKARGYYWYSHDITYPGITSGSGWHVDTGGTMYASSNGEWGWGAALYQQNPGYGTAEVKMTIGTQLSNPTGTFSAYYLATPDQSAPNNWVTWGTYHAVQFNCGGGAAAVSL